MTELSHPHLILMSAMLSFALMTAACSRANGTSSGQTATPSLQPASVIDQTDDGAALGFPDSRKLIESQDGSWYLAYRRKESSSYAIFVGRSLDQGAHWETVNGGRPISQSDNPNPQRVPALAEGPDGVLHLVWYGAAKGASAEAERQIWYAQSANGGDSWTEPVNVSQVPGYDGQDRWQEHANVAVVPDGTIDVVWEGRDQQHNFPQVKLAHSSDGGQTWTPWQNVVPNDRAQSRPAIAYPAAGLAVILAYETDSAGTAHIVASRSPIGSNVWSPWVAVSNSSEDSRNVSLVVDSGGVAVAWRASPDPSSAHIEVARSLDGATWTSPEVIPSTEQSYELFPSMGIVDGRLRVVFISLDKADLPHETPVEGALAIADEEQAGGWAVRVTGDRATIATIARNSDHLGVAFEGSNSGRYDIKFRLEP